MIGLRRASIVGLLALFGAAPLQASIIGETIEIEWFFPDAGSLFATSGNVVVADPGVEWVPGSGVGDIDVSDGVITIENTTLGWTASSGFNGFLFSDVLGTIPSFTSLNLVSIGGFPPPVDPILSFSDDVLSINFNANAANNVGQGTGQLYTFSFTTGDAPEPGTIALLGIGLATIGWAGRRKKSV